MMMMKCQFHLWRNPEYPEKSTALRQVIVNASERFEGDRTTPDTHPRPVGYKFKWRFYALSASKAIFRART